MATDSGLFRTTDQLESDGWIPVGNIFIREQERMLPLYEAKLIHQFEHRLACYSKRPEGSQDTELPRLEPWEKRDPDREILPRYWVQEFDTVNDQRSKPGKLAYDRGVTFRLETRNWHHDWLLGWRDICRSTDERTVISAAIPRAAVSDKYLLAFTEVGSHLLQANLSTFILDYAARQKITGTSLKYYLVKQFPVLPPTKYQAHVPWLSHAGPADWIRERVLELSFTAWDMVPFARDLGDDGAPFYWDEDRRFAMRAELDAAYFHLYGIGRGDVDYIMETFPIVKRKDVERYGSFRTKELILGVYDDMAEAIRTAVPYQTILDPPPGQGPRHPARSDAMAGGRDHA